MGRKNGRKGSATEATSTKLKSFSEEGALRAKRKKLRESKKRSKEEDPFILLLSKNKLFLKELFSKEMKLVSALCNGIVEMEDIERICNCLVRLFYANGSAVPLLKWAIKSEINATSEGALQTFLREDNRMVTQFLKHYSLLMGKEYLVAVLKPAIRKIITARHSYEIDPRHVTQKDRLEKNMKKLRKLCAAILDAVFSTKVTCPPEIQVIACYLNQEVMSKRSDPTPDNFGISCVSTFFFLRFFCPALVSPEDYGIVKKQPTEEAKKGLLLAAKVVQVLANRQRFTQPYLLPLNSFIESYEEAMQNFLNNLASKSSVCFLDNPTSNSSSTVVRTELIEREEEESLNQLKEFCFKNRKKFSYAGM